MCVCVCVREKERQKERETLRGEELQRVCVGVGGGIGSVVGGLMWSGVFLHDAGVYPHIFRATLPNAQLTAGCSSRHFPSPFLI